MKKLVFMFGFVLMFAQVSAQKSEKDVMIIEGQRIVVGDTLELAKAKGLNVYSSVWIKTPTRSKIYVEMKYEGYRYLVKKLNKKKGWIIAETPSSPFDIVFDGKSGLSIGEFKVWSK